MLIDGRLLNRVMKEEVGGRRPMEIEVGWMADAKLASGWRDISLEVAKCVQ